MPPSVKNLIFVRSYFGRIQGYQKVLLKKTDLYFISLNSVQNFLVVLGVVYMCHLLLNVAISNSFGPHLWHFLELEA